MVGERLPFGDRMLSTVSIQSAYFVDDALAQSKIINIDLIRFTAQTFVLHIAIWEQEVVGSL